MFNSIQKRVIVPFSGEVPRAGEAGSVVLNDGRILLIYSRFTGGGADHDVADLYGGIFDPVSGKITEERVFVPNDGALNQMSVSLERLRDGSIGMVYIRKTDAHSDIILFCRSTDEGETWSEPVNCVEKYSQYPYWVVNNDRLRQFANGRLAIPVNIYQDNIESKGEKLPSLIAMLYSDDNGAEWKLSECVKIEDENVVPPHRLAAQGEEIWRETSSHPYRNQEPGVEELPDGRVLLWCRTTCGYMYQAYSLDKGETWGPLKAALDIVSPCGPQSIRRIPGLTRLICVYNDRRHVEFGNGDKHWSWRTPLTLAVSDDCGRSWRNLGQLENEEHNYCYTSILFKDDEVILTTYESENPALDKRRNLASFKYIGIKTQQITAGLRVLFFGSSICAFRGELKTASMRIGEWLTTCARENMVINAGVPGNTTELGRERLTSDVLARKPDIVVMSFGINDSMIDVWKDADKPRLTLERYCENLEFMIGEMKKQGIRVILFTPPPLYMTEHLRGYYGKEPYLTQGFNFMLDRYVEAMRQVAANTGTPVAEANEKFKELPDFMAYSLDGMHPNDAGQKIIAELVWDKIKEIIV